MDYNDQAKLSAYVYSQPTTLTQTVTSGLSIFTKLSGELRNRVYDFTLVHPNPNIGIPLLYYATEEYRFSPTHHVNHRDADTIAMFRSITHMSTTPFVSEAWSHLFANNAVNLNDYQGLPKSQSPSLFHSKPTPHPTPLPTPNPKYTHLTTKAALEALIPAHWPSLTHSFPNLTHITLSISLTTTLMDWGFMGFEPDAQALGYQNPPPPVRVLFDELRDRWLPARRRQRHGSPGTEVEMKIDVVPVVNSEGHLIMGETWWKTHRHARLSFFNWVVGKMRVFLEDWVGRHVSDDDRLCVTVKELEYPPDRVLYARLGEQASWYQEYIWEGEDGVGV